MLVLSISEWSQHFQIHKPLVPVLPTACMSLSVRIKDVTVVVQVLTVPSLLLFRLDHLFLGTSSLLDHRYFIAEQVLKTSRVRAADSKARSFDHNRSSGLRRRWGRSFIPSELHRAAFVAVHDRSEAPV